MIDLVAKLNENQEIQNIESIADSLSEIYESLRKTQGKSFESEYLKKRKELAEIKQKYKDEEKMLAVQNPQL
jgi:lipoate-protein ligase A